MAGKQKEKKSGGNRKKGRAFRPGQSAKRARGRLRLIARKIRHVKRSNGAAFYEVWERERLPILRSYVPNRKAVIQRSKNF